MKTPSDFSKGKISTLIFTLALPLIAAQLVQMLYNVVDRIYIGHLAQASTQALSGLGLTFPLISFIMAFTELFSGGGVPLFSISRGAKEHENASAYLGNTLSWLLISSILVAGFVVIFMEPLLFFLGASTDTYPFASSYLYIYLLGTPLIMISSGMSGFINAQGYSWVSMVSICSGVVLNALLDPLFIFTLDLSIQGAALASVLSQSVSFILVIGFFFTRWNAYPLTFKTLKIGFSRTVRIVKLGLSGFVMQATNGAVQACCNMMLGFYGADLYIGIMTVLNSLRDLSTGPLSGLRNAAQPVIGFNYGAKKRERVLGSIRFLSLTTFFYQLVAWGLIMLFPAFFLSLFSDDPNLIIQGVECVKIYFSGFFMMAFQFSAQSVFVGLGLSKPAVFFSLFRKVILVIPLSILLPQLGFGLYGVFLAEPISNWIGGIACYGWMLKTIGLNSPAKITNWLFKKAQVSS